ncbi:unnamed protein product [Acanthosepion pharaonis]|uniref:PDZ domain-containing protein n=1 Tax=Acanthosepion pharaonis TaxID=158019 RepID=A0A812BYL1_ACAPH|nr:unnamed protein product [Sepia pharaonis]
MTLKVDDQGFVKVTHIQNNSPIGRNGIIKVGDYILSVNNTDIVGQSDSRVQQILRLLPRGLIKVVASAVPISDWKPFTEDAHSKITSYPEVSSVESHVCLQETNEMEEKEKTPISPVPVTRTASLLTKRVDKVETPPSPVSLQPSTTLTGNEQTDHEAPLIVKSSLTLSSAAKTLPQEETKLSASVSNLKKKPLHFCQDGLEVLSSMSNAYEEEKVQNCLPSSVEKLPEVKSEIAISSSPQRAVFSTKGVLSASKIIAERQKPTSPIDTFSSSPLLPEVGKKSPLLASTVQPVLSSKNVTENLVSSPSASQSTYYLETMHNDSAQTSPTSLSPRRFGSTNRKLPDIFQDSNTFKSLSSPTRNKSFLEELAPSESVPIEKNVLEHEDKKVKEISKLEVSPSQTVRAEPKMTSDPKFKSHSIEIIENVPKVEVAVSQCINIEPTKASALLSEVKAEKQSVQVMEDVSKPEVAVSQFIGIRPTTATDLPEKVKKHHAAAVVEEIAKPEVAVSQFIGIKPTTASDLSNVKELKESKVEFSKPDKDASNVKEQEQKIPAPKSEVAVSKFIGLQPTTATKLSEPVKSSPAYNAPKEPEKQSPRDKVKLTSTTQPDIVTSAETGRPALLRYKSTDATLQHVQSPLRKSRNEDSLPTIQNEKSGAAGRRRMEKTRPRSEIFSKEMPGIFSKRKWCISTKSGQTNFAVPSEPETVDRVVQLGLIDEDDLSQLLTSANFALDKMSFSNNHEIHIAILEKDATEKIGIRLKKGEKQELVISLLEPDGAAIKQKFILIGDCLLLVNGKPAWNQTVMDMKVWLQTIETRIILVLGRHPLDGEENDCEYMDIIFHKTVTGIGFCLEGGVGCPLGDRPISVKRIFKGGPAEKGGQLMVGDEILKVNDMDFRKQRHFVAWNHLKFLPAGEVKLHICRRKSQNAGMKAVQLEASSNDSEADVSA